MAANEAVLGKLHEAVTKVLLEALEGTKTEGYVDPDTAEFIEGQIIPPSAAVITVAAKFLKDNNITCTPAEDNELGELARKMAERQKNLRNKVDATDRLAITESTGFLGSA